MDWLVHVAAMRELRLVRDTLQARNSELVERVRLLEGAHSLEHRSAEWVRTRIGAGSMHPKERSLRLLEEALELAQAEGVTVAVAASMVRHIYGRPAGDPVREASGIASCLYAYCASKDVRLVDLATQELARNEAKPVEDIEASVARKVAAGLVADAEPLYYIQNRGFCGDCLLWHKEGGHGYTMDLDQAWKVTKAEAERICAHRPHEDFLRPVSEMDAAAARHVNSESVKLAYRAEVKGAERPLYRPFKVGDVVTADGAGDRSRCPTWMESHNAATNANNAAARGKRKLLPKLPEKLSDFQTRVIDIVGMTGGGIYNAPIDRDTIKWEYGFKGMSLTWRYGLASFDRGDLTMLVLLCHAARIRLAVDPAGPHRLRLSFWPRKDAGATGARHPSVAEAVAAFEEYLPADHRVRYQAPVQALTQEQP